MSRPIAFVAGGSGALGGAICRRLAGAYDIAISYRSNADSAERLADELRAEGHVANIYRAELLNGEEVAGTLAQATSGGLLKVLVYASGPMIDQKYFSQVDYPEWSKTAGAETEAFFMLMRHALPLLRAANGAAVVAVTSFATTRVVPGDVLSAVPKAAIEMLVRQISREEGRFRIRANCVGPGIIDAGLGIYTQKKSYTPEIWDAQRASVPLRRFGTADDIASAVAFLASDDASYITGQLINVDGGMSV